jgi:glyceraldehyde-3-phosphate dehydrogenase (NADP+)
MSIEERVKTIFPEEDNIPSEFRLETPIVQREYLNDGDLLVWNGDMEEVVSPVWLAGPSGLSQKVVGSYPLLTEKEALEALEACVRAYDNGRGSWPKMPVSERIKHVENFVGRMQEKKKDIILLLMWEIGKSCEEAEREFDRTVDYINNTLHALKELDRASSRFVIEQGIIGQIRRAPLGVVLCMGPFNYPLNETFTTLIPALLMGNTAIFKPPKLGVLLHYPLLSALRDSFPPGVVNTVYGDGHKVITPILSTGKVDVLAFIGSSRVADLLKSQHPRPGRLRSVLGLEAKNSAVVLPDADIDLTVQECVKGSLSFNGQRCTALKILFVHSSIARMFLKKFVPAVEELKLGMPWEEGVTITPLPERDKTGYLAGLVDDALRFGAGVINDHGGVINKTFFYPAVLYPVNSEMRVYMEEQFGPIVPVVPFDDIEVPIKYIIGSSYGQQASVFGNEAGIIANLVDVLVTQVCRVNINSLCQRGPDIFPFAARKDSGEGSLSVTDALHAFSIRTIVAAKDADMNRGILEKIVKEHKSSFLSSDSAI